MTFGTFSKRLVKNLSAEIIKAHPEQAYVFRPECEAHRDAFELLRKFKV